MAFSIPCHYRHAIAAIVMICIYRFNIASKIILGGVRLCRPKRISRPFDWSRLCLDLISLFSSVRGSSRFSPHAVLDNKMKSVQASRRKCETHSYSSDVKPQVVRDAKPTYSIAAHALLALVTSPHSSFIRQGH